jgi:hypothetical protein
MKQVTSLPVFAQPNAGIPSVDKNGVTHFPFSPEIMLPYMSDIVSSGASVIGGCCGTTPAHIRAFSFLDISTLPADDYKIERLICSTREYTTIKNATNNMVEVKKAEDIFKINNDVVSIMIDLKGHSVHTALDLTAEIRMMTHKPLMFLTEDDEVLDSVLRDYPGIAAAYTNIRFNSNPYGVYYL